VPLPSRYAATTCKYVFNMSPGDVYWCTADCGWITGHTYLTYGPLLNGATSVVFEGVPTYPNAGRLWEVVAKHKVKQFYTAPTAIRALMVHGDDPVKAHDRSSLQVDLPFLSSMYPDSLNFAPVWNRLLLLGWGFFRY
jgi:acetyl-CoA synthetase